MRIARAYRAAKRQSRRPDAVRAIDDRPRDAFDGAAVYPKSSTGFGVRGLFPQLDRKDFRIDVALPLVRTGMQGPIGFYVAFEQAFVSSSVTPPSPSPAQAILSPLGGALGQ